MAAQWYGVNTVSVDRVPRRFVYFTLAKSKAAAEREIIKAAREYNHFYGYLDGDVNQPYCARPFVNARTITVKPVIVDENKVPGKFKNQVLF